MYVTGGRFDQTGPLACLSPLPFSVGKVRQVLISVVLNSNVLVQIVPNKSLQQELNNVLFCSCCCKDEQM